MITSCLYLRFTRRCCVTRFQEEETQRWREQGGLVMKDLLDVIEWLGRNNIQLGEADYVDKSLVSLWN